MWLIMAILSAFFAGLTSILAKCGIRKTDSDVATALRTTVVLIFSWIMAFIVGSVREITNIDKISMIFIVLSGFATGASWIFYFKALSLGDINKVVPIDKSSTIMTVLMAITIFGETSHLTVKLIGTTLLATGIFLMIEKKDTQEVKKNSKWGIYAILSAIFAAATSILAKIGIDNVDSNLATAIRTCVVLVIAWFIVLIKGKQKEVKYISKKELLFLIFSGFATGASWLCYYYAIKNGIVSIVVPIDKLSIVVTVIFSYIVLKEKLSKKALTGLILMVMGTLVMAIWS